MLCGHCFIGLEVAISRKYVVKNQYSMDVLQIRAEINNTQERKQIFDPVYDY